MEGNDNNTVLEEATLLEIPFFKSSRFKMIMFGAILLIYGIVFSIQFARISTQFSNNMRDAVELQTNYFNGYAAFAPMHLNLNNYLNLYSEDYLASYESSKEELSDFIELLEDNDFGVYSNDLARMCEEYIAAADNAIEYRGVSDEEQMVEYYREADHIKDLISIFNSYSATEIEGFINEELVLLNDSMVYNLQVTIVILAIATVLIIAAASLFVYYFLSPIYSLTTLVRKVSTHSWEIKQIPDARKDEMGLLIRTFYEMLNKNRNQFDELLKKQRLEMDLQEQREKTIRSESLLAKSELKAFQSQINSHFLFNTLNTISRLAYIEDAPRVQNATNLVAQYLRTILNQFNSVVTLSEEFSNVENYIEIQRLRFGNRIQFEGAMDIDFEWFELPSMTIQPLMENAFRHGISERKFGYIKYAAEKEGDSIIIYVWDDGKGIPDEQQEILLNFLQNDDLSENVPECIGLLNVYRRLNLCYPNKVTPVIESEYNKFTKIGFKIEYN